MVLIQEQRLSVIQLQAKIERQEKHIRELTETLTQAQFALIWTQKLSAEQSGHIVLLNDECTRNKQQVCQFDARGCHDQSCIYLHNNERDRRRWINK